MRNGMMLAAAILGYASSVFAAGEAPSLTPVHAPQPIFAELNDGSKIQIDSDGSVWVLDADKKLSPPDGTLTLKDGTPLVVRNSRTVTDN